MMRLESERRKRGLSKLALANRARLASSDLSKIESGRLRPYDRQLRRLARALGLRAEQADSLLEPATSEATAKPPEPAAAIAR